VPFPSIPRETIPSEAIYGSLLVRSSWMLGIPIHDIESLRPAYGPSGRLRRPSG